MKVYIAGSSAESDRAIACAAALQEHGFEVVSTWFRDIVAEQAGIPNPRTASHEDRKRWSERNRDQVLSSDVVWMLAPVGVSHGAYYEAGVADTAGIQRIVSGRLVPQANTKQSIFNALATEFDHDGAALEFLINLKQERSKVVPLSQEERDKAAQLEDREVRQARVDGLCQDIARYLARYDCHNVDPNVDPIDLLRQASDIIDSFQEEIEQLDQQIEGLENTEAEEIERLKGLLAETQLVMVKLDRSTSLRELINRMPAP